MFNDLAGQGIELPDLSRPPPGFGPPFPQPLMQQEILPDDLLPSLPYYDLPAGLMVPLIKVFIVFEKLNTLI